MELINGGAKEQPPNKKAPAGTERLNDATSKSVEDEIDGVNLLDELNRLSDESPDPFIAKYAEFCAKQIWHGEDRAIRFLESEDKHQHAQSHLDIVPRILVINAEDAFVQSPGSKDLFWRQKAS